MATDGLRDYEKADVTKWEHVKFDSLPEFLALTPEDVDPNCGWSFRENNAQSWLGIEGGNDAIKKVAREGYPEGVRRAKKAMSQMHNPPRATSFRRVRIRGDKGKLDMDRFLNNADKDLFIQRKRRKVRGRTRQAVYNIYIDIGANAGVNADEYQWRIHTALAVVNTLRRAGASCRVIGYFLSTSTFTDRGKGKKPNTCVEVVIKEAGQPVNMDRLAMFMLSGMFRRYGFIALGTNKGRKVSWGLGSHDTRTAPLSAQDHDLIISGAINCEAKATELVEWYVGFLND